MLNTHFYLDICSESCTFVVGKQGRRQVNIQFCSWQQATKKRATLTGDTLQQNKIQISYLNRKFFRAYLFFFTPDYILYLRHHYFLTFDSKLSIS